MRAHEKRRAYIAARAENRRGPPKNLSFSQARLRQVHSQVMLCLRLPTSPAARFSREHAIQLFDCTWEGATGGGIHHMTVLRPKKGPFGAWASDEWTVPVSRARFALSQRNLGLGGEADPAVLAIEDRVVLAHELGCVCGGWGGGIK